MPIATSSINERGGNEELFNIFEPLPVTTSQIERETTSQIKRETNRDTNVEQGTRASASFTYRDSEDPEIDALTIYDGRILWGNRAVIPTVIRNLIIQDRHGGHIGIS